MKLSRDVFSAFLRYWFSPMILEITKLDDCIAASEHYRVATEELPSRLHFEDEPSAFMTVLITQAPDVQ